MRRPSGTSAMPRAQDLVGREPDDRPPSNRMSPATGVSAPVIVISVVDLPAPLWPTRPTNSPSLDLEREALDGARRGRS